MTLIRLHNEDWAFETNCFVCEPTNSAGLRIPFFHDTERQIVTAEFRLGDAFSGAPALVHGGVTLAILDEAMAWTCIAIGLRWAVTTETSTTFHKPVYIDKPYRVEAELVDTDGTIITCTGRVIDVRDKCRAEAAATFTVLGEAQATRLIDGPSSSDD